MGRKKTLDECKTGKDFLGFAEQHDGEIIYGGKHPKVKGPNGGSVSVPVHPGDLPPGTARSIRKMLRAVLMLAFLAICALIFLPII